MENLPLYITVSKFIFIIDYSCWNNFGMNLRLGWLDHRYTREIPDLGYCCVMASSAMGLKLGVFGFLPTTHAETNANKMHPQSMRAMWLFTHVYLHAQTPVHTCAPDESWLFWSQEKPEYPQFEPHARIKMAQVLGSLLYICGLDTTTACEKVLV